MAVASPIVTPPLHANVRVGHTSFIHGDGRHFASSRAISESIKKAINFERTKRKKNVGAINHRGRLPDADKSLTYWQHLSTLYPKSPSRLQQKPFPHMAALKITAGDTPRQTLRLQMRCMKRIINIFIYIFFSRRDDLMLLSRGCHKPFDPHFCR